MDLQNAMSVIESCAGFTDDSTPAGEAWSVVQSEIERLRAERIDLVRWMLDRIEDGWHGCVTGDCPHEQASDCIDSLLECFDVDMAAKAAGGEG